MIRYVIALVFSVFSLQAFECSQNIDLGENVYTQVTSRIGFCLRRAATEFELVCIAQLIQVELLRRRQGLAQIQGASLPYSRFFM